MPNCCPAPVIRIVTETVSPGLLASETAAVHTISSIRIKAIVFFIIFFLLFLMMDS